MGFGGLVNGVTGGIMGGLDFLGPNKGKAPQYGSNYQLPHFQQQYTNYGNLAGRADNRQAPQALGFTAAGSGFRGNQVSFGHDLRREARGQGIGQQTVRMQAQDMADRTQAQQYGMAAGARPGQSGQAYTNAAFNAANAQSAVGGQAAMAGAQMQLGAMGQYGQFLQGARGLDQQQNQFNAGQQQQNSQFNTGAKLQQTGMNDQARLELLRQRLAASQAQQQGGLAYEQNAANYQQARMAQPSTGQMLMGGAMGLGSAYMMGGLGGGGAAAAMGGAPTGNSAGSGTGSGYGNPYGYNPINYGIGANG